jgi:hypothetical protein
MQPTWWTTPILLHRTVLNMTRNVGFFGLRFGMYIMICICLGTVYYDLGPSFSDIFNRQVRNMLEE